MAELVALFVLVVLFGIPCYVIAQRRNLQYAWVAFVPLLGPTIILLWSIDRSGWMCLLGLVPLVSIGYVIWLLFTVPAHHGRTRWWGLALLVPLIGLFAYAFTLPKPRTAALAMG